MPTEEINQRADPHATLLTTGRRARWGRPVAVVTAIAFFISLAFPVVAGLSKNTTSFPKWWGTLDVGLAFVLAVLAFLVMVAARARWIGKLTTSATAPIGF